MTVSAIYRPYGMQFEMADVDPLKTLAGITQFNIGANPNIIVEYTDGSIDVTRVSKRGGDESIQVTTENIDDAIDIVGSRFLCQKGTPAQAGVKFFLQQVQQCDTAPGANNTEYQVANHATDPNQVVSMITPVTLQADHQQNANMAIQVTPKGINNQSGIVEAHAVALPAIADNKHRYGLRKLVLDGDDLLGKKSLAVAFNVQVQTESADGDVYPDFVFVDQIGTLLTIRGIDPTWLGATKIPRGGKSFAHANTDFYLARYKDDGTDGYEDDAATSHIAGSMAGKAFITQLAGGQSRTASETVLGLWLEHDGVNVPLQLNTGQAIP